MRRILVTGGCGFIGSHFVRRLLHGSDDVEVVNLDALTYAGNPANLADVEGDERYRFVHGSICDADAVARVVAEAEDLYGRVDLVAANAGVPGHPARLWETPLADWRWVVDVNLWGAVGVAAVVGGGIALVSWAQNALEDKTGTNLLPK